MPQGKNSKQDKNKKPQPKEQEMTCGSCGIPKKLSEYYVSYNPVHSTGRIPYCKTCLKKMIIDDRGNIDINKLKNTLKLIDRPFINDLFEISLNDKMDTFGAYIKNLAMRQYRELTWDDSDGENSKNTNSQNFINSIKPSNFEATDDIIEKWGAGYKFEEYQAFERKYHFLKNNYPEKTAMHTEALLNYIRYRVKEEMSTALGLVKEAKEWGSLAKDAATAAKINPSQLSKADLTEGLSTFSELVRAVEQSIDIIPILPKFKEKPQDKVDFTLWCYINYIRDLKGLPPCEYLDIYQFYEERKKEYQARNKEDIIFEESQEDSGDN